MIREITLKELSEELKKKEEGFSYKGTNGYTGILVPWRVGLSERKVAYYLFDSDGKLVLYTHNASILTMEDLKEDVEGIEQFLDMLDRMKEDTTDDDI